MNAAELADAFPIGSEVTTTVYRIGGHGDRVTGVVTGHRHGHVMVRTLHHGELAVEPGKAQRSEEGPS